MPYGTWQKVAVTVRNALDGSVALELFIDGRLLARATDAGVGGPPITRAGKIGIRGDNAEFSLADFTVTALPGDSRMYR